MRNKYSWRNLIGEPPLCEGGRLASIVFCCDPRRKPCMILDEALRMLGPDEAPDSLESGTSSALITFAYKVGELAFQAGDEDKALDYIGLSGKIVEDILHSIKEPEWREAYEKKRERILETYRRLKPAMTK